MQRKWVRSPSEIPVSEWINTSNHDSCWNSDGFSFISNEYFKMCKEINPNIAPKFVDTNARFCPFSYPVKSVKSLILMLKIIGIRLSKLLNKRRNYENTYHYNLLL